MPLLGAIPALGYDVATAHDAAEVIVTPDVEEDVVAAEIANFRAHHAAIRLEGTVAAHAEVANRLTQVGGEVLLPRFVIA